MILKLFWVFPAVLAYAQVPPLMTYQGRIAAGAEVFEGVGQFKLALVDGGTSTASTATASATVVNGFLVSITLLNGGAGYSSAPSVTISDATGTGAMAVAQILNGSVSRIVLQSAGFGYSDFPVITLAPPAASVDYITYWSHDGSSVGGSEPSTSLAIPVSKGLFTVVLGDTSIPKMSPLPPAAFQHPEVRLRIWFSNGRGPFEQLTPDQRLSSAGYALIAGNVPDGAINAAKLAPSSIGVEKLVPALRARLDGPPSGGVILSEDPAATNLFSTGYTRVSGARVVREEWQQWVAETDFDFGFLGAQRQTAVWSGSEAILLSSMGANGVIGTRYNPVSNTWRDVSTNNFPPALWDFGSPEAVWTGNRLLAFAGGPDILRGGQYDPAADSWTHMNTNQAPLWDSLGAGRGQWVWTGKDLLVFSTGPEGLRAAAYRAETDTWTTIPTNGFPRMDGNFHSIWTGTEVILIGIDPGGSGTVGGRFQPGTASWSQIPTNNAPALDFFRGGNTPIVVWTGKELLALGFRTDGGFGLSGARYAPAPNKWSPISTNGAPDLSFGSQAVWTGSELLVWNDPNSGPASTSARYKPNTDTWVPMNRFAPSVPAAAEELQAIWTGKELLVGFTRGFSAGVAAASYNPGSDRWSLVPGNGFMAGDPTGVQTPITLWTGDRLLLFTGSMHGFGVRGYVMVYTPMAPLYLYQRQ